MAGPFLTESELKRAYGMGYREFIIWMLVVIAPMLFGLYAIEHFQPLDERWIVRLCGPGFLVTLMLVIRFYRRLFPWAVGGARVIAWLGVIPFALWGAALTLGVALATNGLLDRSSAQTVSAKVVEASFFKEVFKVVTRADAWKAGFYYRFTVPRERSREFQIPAVTVTTKKGYWGIEWIVHQEPPT